MSTMYGRHEIHTMPIRLKQVIVLRGAILRVSNYPLAQLEFQNSFLDEKARDRHLVRIRCPLPPD